MAGNRALYDRAMEQHREAARKHTWDEALKQAVRALQEFSSDTDARAAAAVALYNTGKHAQSLQIWEELRNADPNNPFVLEYIARVNEQMGNIIPAVTAYAQLADIQISRRLEPKAIEALREVLRLRPSADDQRLRLARLLEENGGTADSSAEYLTLAKSAQEQGRLDQAERHTDSALRLAPNSRELKEYSASLHGAIESAALASVSNASDAPAPASLPGMTGGLRGQQFAIDRLVAQAQELQEKGDNAGALDQYARALSMGAERPDVFYSLGLLYQERGDHQQAVQMLRQAAIDAEYALSAHYSLGSSLEALGQLPQAAQEYEQTIRLVDLQSIGKAESEDLVQMYESTANIYTQLNDSARAASLYSTLANFLGSKRWGRERAEDFRRKAKELTERNMFAKLRTLGTGALTALDPSASVLAPDTGEPMPETWGKIRPITDFLKPDRIAASSSVDIFATPSAPAAPVDVLAALDSLPEPTTPHFKPLIKLDTSGLDDTVEKYVLASEKYAEQGLIVAANDACMEVIRLEPNYLPIHMRMGEIYEREGKNEEALTKYQLLIDTYVARSEARRAIDVYYRLIDLSPDTINARARLADLLKQDGRVDAAAEQLVQVANAYFRMGQTNKALEEYRRGLQWAPNSAPLHAQYGQALLKLERFEAALGEFRRALELDQSNIAGIARVNAALALMGDHPTAVWQSLATLLERLQQAQHGAALNEVQVEYRSALLVQDAALLHYILGIVQQRAGQQSSALLELEQAADLLASEEDPMLPAVLVFQAMADSYIALGQADDALAQLKRGQAAGSATPNTEFARYPFATPLSQGEIVRRMAEAFAASGDLEGAERALQQAKRQIPNDRTIYTKLADIYFRQGKLNEATTQLDELATYYERQQDIDTAIETLEYGLKLAPNNIPIGLRWAQMNLRRGYLDKGIEGLSKVAEQQRKAGQLKDAVASLQQVADVHWTLGQQEQAREIYDRIIKIAPNDIEARQWLSFMYTLAGRTEDAISEKKQIVRLLMQQRDLENAIAELHQIIGIDQSDTEAYYQLGDVLMRREEYDQAVRIYGRLSKMPNVETERVAALQSAAKRMHEQQQTRAKV
ncbi:MAG: tetratricopeptide repeat protein [Roseiflexaceae bacterium]|nr:tetratricopeptide repeat protein [Roseiflexaceae bacterium]